MNIHGTQRYSDLLTEKIITQNYHLVRLRCEELDKINIYDRDPSYEESKAHYINQKILAQLYQQSEFGEIPSENSKKRHADHDCNDAKSLRMDADEVDTEAPFPNTIVDDVALAGA